ERARNPRGETEPRCRLCPQLTKPSALSRSLGLARIDCQPAVVGYDQERLLAARHDLQGACGRRAPLATCDLEPEPRGFAYFHSPTPTAANGLGHPRKTAD